MTVNQRKHVGRGPFRSRSATKNVRKGERISGKQAETAQAPNGEDPSSDPREAFASAMRETIGFTEAGDLEAARRAFDRVMSLRRALDAEPDDDAAPEGHS